MLHVSDDQFADLISQAMDEMPEQYIAGLQNVLVTYEDEPSAEQRQRLKLGCNQSLFGLYEGIPLTKRGAGYNLVLPDRITIFKKPMISMFKSLPELRRQVKHTLWHEVAHYYGLDHDRIHEIERNWH